MGWKNSTGLCTSIIVLCFSQAAIAGSASVISRTDKMLAGAFQAKGRFCDDARTSAIGACEKWAKGMRDLNPGATSWCRYSSCECKTDGYESKAACLGTSTFEVVRYLRKDKDGKVTGIRQGRAIDSDPRQETEGVGITCMDARYDAVLELYRALQDMSADYEATGLLTTTCSCTPNKSGDFVAKCRGGLQAKYKAAYRVD